MIDSHISAVKATRIERALERAFAMQFLTEDGLSMAKARYSTTLASSTGRPERRKPSAAPDASSTESHSVPARPPPFGLYSAGRPARRCVAWMMRARKSARSM